VNAVIKQHIVTPVKKYDIYIENYQPEDLVEVQAVYLQLMKISL